MLPGWGTWWVVATDLLALEVTATGTGPKCFIPMTPLITQAWALAMLDCQVSPIGLILKPHQPRKWRLIVDLSSPCGASLNDVISSELCHLHYASVLDAASLIRPPRQAVCGVHSQWYTIWVPHWCEPVHGPLPL